MTTCIWSLVVLAFAMHCVACQKVFAECPGKLGTTVSSLRAFAADKAETCGRHPVMYNSSLAHANLCIRELLSINTADCFGLCGSVTPEIMRRFTLMSLLSVAFMWTAAMCCAVAAGDL